jgi:hypothetical protein
MSTSKVIQQQLDEVDSMIDEVIDQMADIYVWVQTQNAQVSTTEAELYQRIMLADQKRIVTNRALDLLDLSRKRIASIGDDAVRLSKVIGPNHPSIRVIALRVEQLMNRMKRTAPNLQQLLNNDVIGLWQFLRTQCEAIQRQTTHPALSLHHHANPSN